MRSHADAAFAKGSTAGATADKYVRATMFLATVLFLVGISGHFRIRQAAAGSTIRSPGRAVRRRDRSHL